MRASVGGQVDAEPARELDDVFGLKALERHRALLLSLGRRSPAVFAAIAQPIDRMAIVPRASVNSFHLR